MVVDDRQTAGDDLPVASSVIPHSLGMVLKDNGLNIGAAEAQKRSLRGCMLGPADGDRGLHTAIMARATVLRLTPHDLPRLSRVA